MKMMTMTTTTTKTDARSGSAMQPHRAGLLLASMATGMIAVTLATAQSAPPSTHTPSQTPSHTPSAPASGMRGTEQQHAGHIPAPPRSEALSTALAVDGLQMYKSADFEGTGETIANISKEVAAGTLNMLPGGLADSMTSLRWNLAPGVIVVFYEDGDGDGEQLVLWGSAQSSNVSKMDMNDKASRWAWYDIGGSGPRSAEASMRPHGTAALETAVPDDALQLFKDAKFRNDMQQVNPVTATPSGEVRRGPAGLGDALSSMRWNLPPGVIVTLYQDVDGDKQQIAIWGQGQVSDLDDFDFNDKFSGWSWAYIGDPKFAPTAPHAPATPNAPSKPAAPR